MHNIKKLEPAKPQDIATGLQRWTPARANKVFNTHRYERNRNEVRGKSHIAAMARMMRGGAWRDGGAIEFARHPDGKLTLLDGHHRLLAQVEAGVDVVWSVIVHEVADDDEMRNLFWTYDTTLRKRTMRNVLSAVCADEALNLDMGTTAALGSAVVFIDGGMRVSRGGGAKLYTPDERLDLISQWGGEAEAYADCISQATKTVRKKMLSTQIMAVALVTLRAMPEKAREFWAAIALDDGLRRGDPRKTLVDWMRDTHLSGGGQSSAAAAAARAWAAFVAGKEISYIRIGTQPVKIAGSSTVVRP